MNKEQSVFFIIGLTLFTKKGHELLPMFMEIFGVTNKDIEDNIDSVMEVLEKAGLANKVLN